METSLGIVHVFSIVLFLFFFFFRGGGGEGVDIISGGLLPLGITKKGRKLTLLSSSHYLVLYVLWFCFPNTQVKTTLTN